MSEFVTYQRMVAQVDAQMRERAAWAAKLSPRPVAAAPMTPAQATAADLHSAVNKAERAHRHSDNRALRQQMQLQHLTGIYS